MSTRRDLRYLLFLLGYPLAGLLFGVCEWANPTVVNQMEWSVIDRTLPFVSWMVVPYVFWYFTIFFTFAWTAVKEPEAFVRFCSYVTLATVSACLLYLVFPNGQTLRPDPAAFPPTWDHALVAWIYGHDTPTNSNPSIHVIDAIGVWIALGRDKTLGRSRIFLVVLAAVSLAVIASTVLLKQHSILDVLGGTVWAFFWASIVYHKSFPAFRFVPK